jgi:hypothetical protein
MEFLFGSCSASPAQQSASLQTVNMMLGDTAVGRPILYVASAANLYMPYALMLSWDLRTRATGTTAKSICRFRMR